jgi:hypothetical protein
MGEDIGISLFEQQLIEQSPLLIAYVIGLALALIFRSRCPIPCALAATAMALMLIVTLGAAYLSSYLIQRRSLSVWSVEDFSRMLEESDRLTRAVGLISNVVRALGIGLLLTAVFVSRGRRPVLPDPDKPGLSRVASTTLVSESDHGFRSCTPSISAILRFASAAQAASPVPCSIATVTERPGFNDCQRSSRSMSSRVGTRCTT